MDSLDAQIVNQQRRLPYNAILTLIVRLRPVLTWPQFRPALAAGALGKFVLVLGMPAALVLENYLPTKSIRRCRRKLCFSLLWGANARGA